MRTVLFSYVRPLIAAGAESGAHLGGSGLFLSAAAVSGETFLVEQREENTCGATGECVDFRLRY